MAVETSIEIIKPKSPAEAMTEMSKLQRPLDKIHKQMLSTERTITNMDVQLVGRTADDTMLWKAMERL